ncbi:MAG: serine/threonine-protein phosphatase [Pirellulaceae bacterium]|nr:serine/threonine-protein phosphatase [Pirellulaceae bacterium]
MGSSLMSVSALNVLRSQALPQTDFRNPTQVLQALNTAFAMELHDNKYFTIWYGVYRKSTRQLTYTGGGHPPALLLSGPSRQELTLTQLDSQGPLIGMLPDVDFETQTVDLAPAARLLLFSDGVFEIEQANGEMWEFDDFLELIRTLPPDESLLDRLLQHAQTLHGSEQLTDDFSLVEVEF